MDSLFYHTDTATLQQIFSHLSACDENFNPPLSTRGNLEAYANKIQQSAVRFECWNGVELIGLVAAYLNDAVGGKGFITNVSVDKNYFGKGIALELMKNCLAYARKNNFKTLALEVFESNEPAIRLYKKLDFEPTATANHFLKMAVELN